jgi:hypothetical protein
MRKDFYLELSSEAEALRTLTEIDRLVGGGDRWSEPIHHPYSSFRLIPWNLGSLQSCSHLLENRKRLTPDQALRKGYDIGFHRGKFSQASRKIEEARHILELMPLALSVPNFAACRALFYGFQSSVYATREALKASCGRIGGDAQKWWKATEAEIRKSEPFIHFLHVDYNTDKHGEASGMLSPSLKLYGYKGLAPDVVSAEGVFKIENKGSARERRVFLPNIQCEMTVNIAFDPQIIGGQDVTNLPLTEKMAKASDFMEEIVAKAKSKFP